MVAFKTFAEALEKQHPSDDIYHEITWWITRRMTLQEWIDLDDAMCEAFSKVGLDDEYIGVAGPIPFDEKDLDEAFSGSRKKRKT